ncbi:hypothetical protein EDC96DRAFT_572853 [Choanephora cucurbitarum]|nr:hypothetical protein EDC96DRAFT_572853 [Choanephora cucurbitarum]
MTYNCIICFGSLLSDPNESAAAAPCGHVFHNNCIRPWINQSKKCPLCKKTATLRHLVAPLYFSTTEDNEPGESASSSSSDLTRRTRDLQVQLASSNREVESLRNELQLIRRQNADHILEIEAQNKKIRSMTNSMRYLKQVKRVADIDDYLSSPTSQSFMKSLQHQPHDQLITTLGGLEYRYKEAVRGRDSAESKLAINERAVNSLKAKNEKLKDRLKEYEKGQGALRNRPRRKYANVIVLDSEDEGEEADVRNEIEDIAPQQEDKQKQRQSTENHNNHQTLEQSNQIEDHTSNQPASQSTSTIGNPLFRGIARDLALLSDDEEYAVEEHVSPMHNRFQYKRLNNELQLQAAGQSPKRLKTPSGHNSSLTIPDDDVF